jgi:hypothetical protein
MKKAADEAAFFVLWLRAALPLVSAIAQTRGRAVKCSDLKFQLFFSGVNFSKIGIS